MLRVRARALKRSTALNRSPRGLAILLLLLALQITSTTAQISQAGSASVEQPQLRRAGRPKVDAHAEALRFRRLKLQDENGKIPADAWTKAQAQKKQMPYDPQAWSRHRSGFSPTSQGSKTIRPLRAGIESSGWTSLGPGNIGGRVRSLLIHPTTPNTMWVGSVGGGVWKTTNSGVSWFPLDDFMANLAVGCMVMDPADPNIIYAGTGEGFGNADAIDGAGIFKTTNGGATWTQLASTAKPEFSQVNRLAISPASSQLILAATGFNGIWLSADGGLSWTQTFSGGQAVLDVAFDPGDGSKAIASGGQGLALFSSDGGNHWSPAAGIPSTGSGRVEIAYAPSNPSVVYASVERNNGELYGSTDGGKNYGLRNSGQNYFLDSDPAEQGWYDNCLWVDPTNPNNLLVGGINLRRSFDGGFTLGKIPWLSVNAPHTDYHVIVSAPGFDGTTVTSVFWGSDGGVFKSDDIYASPAVIYANLNSHLEITQFYGGAGNPSNGQVIGGAQDNGTELLLPGAGTEGWSIFDFANDPDLGYGDGGICAADSIGNFYGEYNQLQITRNWLFGNMMPWWTNFLSAAGSITDAGSGKTANWQAPFLLDPNIDPNSGPETMLAGGASLWRTLNAANWHEVSGTPPTWTAIKPPISGTLISSLAIAPGNSDVIWVGYNDGEVWSTANGTTANPVFTTKTATTPGWPGRMCTSIAIDPADPNHVFVTFGGFTSGNVWSTADGGATWSDVTGNLPHAPALSIAINPHESRFLYLGTAIGVFASSDGGANWSPSNDGPANVEVDQLFWVADTLYAATHGRGMFALQPIVWVDFNYLGSTQNGNFATPFHTLAQAVNAVASGSDIFIKTAGSSAEKLTISKPMTISAFAGAASIGH